MRQDLTLVALGEGFEEIGDPPNGVPDPAWWWVCLVPPPDELPPDVEPGVYECDSFTDACDLGRKLLEQRQGFGALIIGFHPDMARVATFAAIIRPADESQTAYTIGDVRRAVKILNVSNTAMQRVRDRRRADFVKAESATVPPPLPATDVTNDHLYANKVAFPDSKADAGTKTTADVTDAKAIQLRYGEQRPFPNPGLIGGEGGGR